MNEATAKSYTADTTIKQGVGTLYAVYVYYDGTTDNDLAILKNNGTEIWRWMYDDTDSKVKETDFQFGPDGILFDTLSLAVTVTGNIYVTVVWC